MSTAWPSAQAGAIAAVYGVYDDGGVVLLDTHGARLRPEPVKISEGYVTSVAFSPGGVIAAGYGVLGGGSGGGVVLLDTRGEALREPIKFKFKEGCVNGVAFGPGGVIAAGYAVVGPNADSGGVVLLDPTPPPG